MIHSSLLAIFLVFVICSFCERDFVSLGRHSWRCKRRVVEGQEPRTTVNQAINVLQEDQAPVKCNSDIKCCCGKFCKGIRGLKMHQRSCRVMDGLAKDAYEELEDEMIENSIDQDTNDIIESQSSQNFGDPCILKKGIKLPKSPSEWSTANDYFKSTLSNYPIKSLDLDSNISFMSTVIYNYCVQYHGVADRYNDADLKTKYKDFSIKDLKKALKELKIINNNVQEIKFVSRQLRYLLSKKDKSNCIDHRDFQEIDCDKSIERNFWGFVKQVFQKQNSILPTFSKAHCLEYFKTSFSAISPNKAFHIPAWIPQFSAPDTPFNLDAPTYQQITNVINKMKSSGTPCPLDQISIICFKRCPYLRSYLTEIIHVAWKSGAVPSNWKRACTILVHKKGDQDNPANFRPITLESIPLKIFTSCLRNKIFQFLAENNYIEHTIQKGFTPKLSGTLEHTAHMAHIINNARLKQRSLIITLLDLKNAFGEVHHNLIGAVLKYHHIPPHIALLVKSLYRGFQTSVLTSDFTTPYITVERGVLQGDCLSPLLFNLCFNTFIQHIKSEKFCQLGFCLKNVHGFSFTPTHWFQFADDAAVISGQEQENQMLLNRFTIWCQWAGMTIRVDKCCTFGIKKVSSKSAQVQPKLFINKEMVPCVKHEDSFRYLGRHFDFHMSNQVHKIELSNLVTSMLNIIDSLPLHPNSKLLLYNRYLLSKISWHFTGCDLSKTWIIQHLDNTVSHCIRKWLDLPISSTLSNILLPHEKFGLDIILPSTKFAQCQTVRRNALKSSPNEAIRNLWKDTSNNMNVQYDIYKNTKEVLKAVRSEHEMKLQNDLISQGWFFSIISQQSILNLTSAWSSVQRKLPKNIFNFSIKYINNTLPTRSNLHKWGLSPTSDCSFCSQSESLLHVIAGCQNYLTQGRFTWRHDSILHFIAKAFQSIPNSTLYADVPGFVTPSVVTGDSLRPDLVLHFRNKCLYIVELTVGFESNLAKNSNRKRLKYLELVNQLTENYNQVKFVNLSISSLGLFDKSSCAFIDMMKDLDMSTDQTSFTIRKIMNIAIRSSYYIFCCRNREWCYPELMNY